MVGNDVACVMGQLGAEGLQVCGVSDDGIIGIDGISDILRFKILGQAVGHGFPEIDFGIDFQKGSGDGITEMIQIGLQPPHC